MSKRTYHEVVRAREEAQFTAERYLRSHGWKYTSDTPGCLWLWEKKTEDGRVMLLSTDTAISMQTHSCSIRGNKW